MPLTRLARAAALSLVAAAVPAAAREAEPPWAVLDEIDGVEVAVDTLHYTHASDPESGTTYRVYIRFRYVARSATNAALWDRGGRAVLLEQDVFCARGGGVDLRTHRASVLRDDGSVLAEQPAPPEWITPPRGSAGASYGRQVCRVMPRVGA